MWHQNPAFWDLCCCFLSSIVLWHGFLFRWIFSVSCSLGAYGMCTSSNSSEEKGHTVFPTKTKVSALSHILSGGWGKWTWWRKAFPPNHTERLSYCCCYEKSQSWADWSSPAIWGSSVCCAWFSPVPAHWRARAQSFRLSFSCQTHHCPSKWEEMFVQEVVRNGSCGGVVSSSCSNVETYYHI